MRCVFVICLLVQHANGDTYFKQTDIVTSVMAMFALLLTTNKWYTHCILIYCAIVYSFVWYHGSLPYLGHVSDFTDAIVFVGLILSTKKCIAWVTGILVLFEIANGYENNSYIGEIANILMAVYIIHYLSKKRFITYA